MKMKKSFLRISLFPACLLFLLQVGSAHGAEVASFPVGSQIAPFTVGAPGSPEVQKYLGLKGSDPFKLSDISAKMVVVEFFNSM
jgi:hypothetical protein